ncbi:YhcN/YlaJ family sporulation lipoprotein [Paenibacillus pinistramenti]|uniref:YhcN/YlaJ family sporulation lipoprotein n=1 Tax=Paenibacillus pinistramenti TaxID=1768003 RepID=UPI001108C161|nr:YhcN/YlaJ family sporulation lipoprotein [Paenibacillus pinistramenti]
MRSWICILAAAAVITSLTGCGAKNGAGSASNAQNQTQRMQSTAGQGARNLNQTQINNNTNQQGQLSADQHLEQLAVKVPGVKSAHVVMMGNTAIIGIDVDGKLDRSRVGTIKYSVAEAVHKDPRGANAIVTADADLSHRLAEMGSSIREGRPLKGMANELADLIGRIVPQMPGDVKKNEDIQQISPSQNPVNKQNIPNANGQNSNRNLTPAERSGSTGK